MRSRECIPILALASACALGCASAPTAPRDWLPTAKEAPSGAFGGWIELELLAERDRPEVDGELLAIQNERVYVLQGESVRPVPIDSIYKAKLTWYDSQPGQVAAGTVLGTLLTLSNGWYLVFTAPTWIIGGSVASSTQSREPIIEESKHAWSEFVPYARFPQGLPPDFEAPSPPVTPEPAVAEAPPPPPPPPIPITRDAGWGFALGGGVARYESQSDLAAVVGMNLSKKWVSLGIRFSLGSREPLPDSNSELAEDGMVFDLGLLVGVRGTYRALQVAARAGPAAWGLNIGEFEDVKAAFAAQGELFVYFSSNVGFGAIVTYNDNSLKDYFIAALGIAIGPR